MANPYVIITDISADVNPELIREKDIHIISMRYTLGAEERVCSGPEDESTLHRFYDGQRGGDMTRTTQVSQQQYIDTLSPLLEEGTYVLCLCLSSGLSGTYASCCLIAEELNEKYPNACVRPVDSLAATAGMGLLLEKACENRDAGMSLEENAKWLEENRLRVAHWFMVEDLMYLKRGGRVSAATAVVGTALNIKPILKIENDGTLSSFAKKRGTKAAVRQLVDYYREARVDDPNESLYIVHADAQETADLAIAGIREINPTANIHTMMLTPIIGAHVGPGMCAIIHWGKR